MTVPMQSEGPEQLYAIYKHFREYFDMAEKRRRWSIKDDIPWAQANRSLNPAFADIMETFCAVELYLPDYLAKLIPQVRTNRGRSWMLANWGYEECKHSMAFEDWLLNAEMRTEGQVADMHEDVFSKEWDLPYDNARAMVIYTMFQELATQIHYSRMREAVAKEGGCPALDKALLLVAKDEAAHADFFRKLVAIYLEYDRPGTIEQIRVVVNTFNMPATHLLTDSARRQNTIRKMQIFDEAIYIEKVLTPVIERLGVTRKELRRKNFKETVVPLAGPNAKP